MRHNLMVLVFMVVLLLGFIADRSTANNYGHSRDGTEGVVTLKTASSADSARFFFGFDGDGSGDASGNLYESVKLLPSNADSTTLSGYTLDLDSIGVHLVEVYYWLAGQDSTSDIGIWLHEEAIIGSGTMPWQFWLLYVDTSAVPDDTVSEINAHLQNQTGSNITGTLTSNSAGYAGPYRVSDSIEVVVSTPNGFSIDAIGTIVTANDTLLVPMYSLSTTNYGVVFAYEFDPQSGSPRVGAIVEASLFRGPVTDTTNGFTINDLKVYDTTDAFGYWAIPLLRTDMYDEPDKGYYRLKATYKPSRTKITLWEIWPTGSDSTKWDSLYVPTTGNVNVTEHLAER